MSGIEAKMMKKRETNMLSFRVSFLFCEAMVKPIIEWAMNDDMRNLYRMILFSFVIVILS
jgi:hypothetical protein